jgi:hypothetical protein
MAAYYVRNEIQYARSQINGGRSFRSHVKLRRVRLLRLSALIMTVLAVSAVSFFSISFAGDDEAHAASASSAREAERMIVKPGDTLWSIAKSRTAEGEDLRAYIYKLKKVNGLKNANLQAGQTLVLP